MKKEPMYGKKAFKSILRQSSVINKSRANFLQPF